MTRPGLQRWLLTFALLMRVMVPSGFMFDAATAATPTLIACDGHGPIFALPSSHDHHHSDHRGVDPHGDCPTSAPSGAADTPAAPVLPAAIDWPTPPANPIAANRPDRPLLAAPLPPQTGPPFIA